MHIPQKWRFKYFKISKKYCLPVIKIFSKLGWLLSNEGGIDGFTVWRDCDSSNISADEVRRVILKCRFRIEVIKVGDRSCAMGRLEKVTNLWGTFYKFNVQRCTVVGEGSLKIYLLYYR